MRIEIDPAVANDENSHRWLDRLLNKIEDGWHVWEVTGLEPYADTSWVRERGTQGKWVRRLHVESIRRSIWAPPVGRKIRVTDTRVDLGDSTPEDAARLAEEPLIILVENRISDGAFISRVVRELDTRLFALWQRPGEPVRIDSLGGKDQMREWVRSTVADARVRPRLVVVVDSDRRDPVGEPSATARRLEKTCDELGVPCWVLAKREAENYLPRVLLDERQDQGAAYRRQVDAWDRLSDDQKDFYDMKDGLREEPSPAEEALFGGLTEADRRLLAQGFGPNVHKCWERWNVQAARALRDRGRGDLERGLAKLWQEV